MQNKYGQPPKSKRKRKGKAARPVLLQTADKGMVKIYNLVVRGYFHNPLGGDS